MGRNGKVLPVFPQVVAFISGNNGKVVTANDILLGHSFDRGAATSYLYKFIKLGYVKPLESSVLKQNKHFKIVRFLPPNYSSVQLKADLRKMESEKKG